ncbi:outer membrane protein [Pseudaminobacter soli (ex Li et al. 2025)]|uniref:Porin family protein n=1 Tax=Pseudaminobacter soli (ex Li et al. 2025) TaxID=1295366 RepID=A0A2P7S785_9HYPH|nr:outer membrane protein [Mesorhizobium soli]PSJ58291.1 porin family protein [Mesorhizobium soli]
MFSKRIAVLAAFSTLLSTGAFAADVVSTEPAIPVFSWTGAYVGLNVGFGGGDAKHPYHLDAFRGEIQADGSIDATTRGFLGGVQAGYNHQIDQWVLGVEADFQGANIEGEAFDDEIREGVRTKLDWYGTLRARAGVLATDRFLVYGTGGAAYGHIKTVDDGESFSKTKSGWTIGAGAEFAVTNNVTFKAEYAYTDLGKTNLIQVEGVNLNYNQDQKVNFHSVKFGINYKF